VGVDTCCYYNRISIPYSSRIGAVIGGTTLTGQATVADAVVSNEFRAQLLLVDSAGGGGMVIGSVACPVTSGLLPGG
jgi:hypothetical protein